MRQGNLKLAATEFAGRLATAAPPKGPEDPPSSTPNFITPGEIIRAEFMEPSRLSESDLAVLTSIHPATLKKLLDGTLSMTPVLASYFSQAYGASVEFFMNLQTGYDQRINNFRQTMAKDIGPPRAALQSPFLR
jgi:addiction module HigA family antidote